MTTDTESGTLALPADLEIECAGAYGGKMPGEGRSVSTLERDIMARFDADQVTYQNEWAANTVGGYTFADFDHDGWYDHLERTTSDGSWVYMGNDIWAPA